MGTVYLSYNWGNKNKEELREILELVEELHGKGERITSRFGNYDAVKKYILGRLNENNK